MITSELYKDKCYGVLGTGKAGKAAIASLKASGAEIYSWDDKNATPSDTHYDAWPWQRINAIIMSPGIPLTHPKPHPIVALAEQHNVEMIGDVELLYRAHPNATFIGITGTNGKSTTTALIGHIIEQANMRVEVGGNLGTPAMALQEAPLYVLEMSSFQLELVRNTCFHIAVWLNISPDHIDRHGDMDGYVRAKQHIFDHQTTNDLAIIGTDDEISRNAARDRAVRVTYISSRDDVRHKLQNARTLQGEHNHQNAAAAYAVCRELGIHQATILDAMHSFPGLAHRMQWIKEHKGVSYVNDSKATNADAAEKSLRTFDNIFWLAGGIAKDGDIAPLKTYFSKLHKAYLYGQDAQTLAARMEDTKYAIFKTMQEAFEAAHLDAQKQTSGTVLLAPACASFDQFESFEQRGDVFCALVKEATHG